MDLKEEDFFNHPRYSTVKSLLKLIGQWPYQNKTHRILLCTTAVVFSMTALPAQIAKVVVNRTDWLVIIPTVGPILVHLGFVVKVANCVACDDKMLKLLKRIQYDWRTPMGSEKVILAEYADHGRLFTLIYTAWLYISLAFFLMISLVPQIIIMNGWANLSASNVYPIPVHYTSHDEDYYWYLMPYLCCAITLMISIAVAVDGLFVVFVQHGCGLFAMIGYRLENTLENEDLQIELHPNLEADKTFWVVSDCIKKHKAAIEYATLLDSAYSTSFLFMLGLNTLSISFTGLQVIWGATPEDVDEAIRQGLFGGSQIIHLLFQSLFSQRLTDHSMGIFHSLTKSNWYLMSIRTRKLISFMLIKSMMPFELKAGKVYVMSIANFGAVLRTSMSYLTILASME